MAYNTNAYVKVGTSLQRVNLSTHWDMIDGRPSTFTSTPHDHDNRYNTKSEITTLLSSKVTGSGYSGRLAFWTDTNSIEALSTVYPSVDELIYVKGVSSSIQTQLNGKAASGHTHSNYLTTSGTAYNSTRWGNKQLRVGAYSSVTPAAGYITMGY